MKVVHVITCLGTGGAEGMLFKLLCHGGGGEQPLVVSLMSGGALERQIEAIGVPVRSLGMRRGRLGFFAVHTLSTLLRDYAPDAVQGWMQHGNLAATIAVAMTRRPIPIFWNIRQSLYDIKHESWMTRLSIRASARLSSRPQAILYNSRISQQQHEVIGYRRDKSRWVPNGFDCVAFKPDATARKRFRAEMGLRSEAFLIGMVARYHPMKDHATFLTAASHLAREYPEACFVLIGTGLDHENMELAAMVAALSPKIQLRLLGERGDLSYINAALDIASLSSWTEAFPNVLGEAMACAVPCVATDVGETAGLIGDTGVIVPARSPEKLAAAWKVILQMDAGSRQAMGARARSRVEQFYSIEAVARQYTALYESLIDQYGGTPLQTTSAHNRDEQVVQGFSEEWSRFSQEGLAEAERSQIFSDYFASFPWGALPQNALGADIGCGSGRWADVVSQRVGRLVCVDASYDALQVARRNLAQKNNVEFCLADVGSLPFADGELDFVYSLGVLHHVPDTRAAIAEVARIVKPGGLALIYLYYAFDNRPWWFRLIWRISDGLRRMISRAPKTVRFRVCDLIAAVVYWPLARGAAILHRLGYKLESYPLWYYHDRSFYVMRTDALDRFGTQLEQRFTRAQIEEMMMAAGFVDIRFNDSQPYWCAQGLKRALADRRQAV